MGDAHSLSHEQQTGAYNTVKEKIARVIFVCCLLIGQPVVSFYRMEGILNTKEN